MLSPELRWLFRQALPLKQLYLVRLAAVVVTSFLFLIDPLILKWLIDDILPWRKADLLVIVSLGFTILFLFRFGFASISRFIDTYTTERLMFDIRQKMLRHLQKLPTGVSPQDFDGRNPASPGTRRRADLHFERRDSGFAAAHRGDHDIVHDRHAAAAQLAADSVGVAPCARDGLVEAAQASRASRAHPSGCRNATHAASASWKITWRPWPHVQLLNRQAGERRRFARHCARRHKRCPQAPQRRDPALVLLPTQHHGGGRRCARIRWLPGARRRSHHRWAGGLLQLPQPHF